MTVEITQDDFRAANTQRPKDRLSFVKWDGKPICAAGAYEDVPMDAYHGQLTVAPSISSSGLRTIWNQSPAHYFLESYLNEAREPPPERPHFSLGRAAHHLLFLGRKGFDAEFVVRPEKWSDWRTKEAKEWRADQIEAGMTIITDAELGHITGMARSLAKHPLVKAGILDGAVERSMVFQHHTGVWLKSRPDCIPNDSGDTADLKTVTSVSADSLRRSLRDYGYHVQAALAGMAMKATLDIEMTSFSLVWVEKTPPYCCRVTAFTPEDLLRGQMQVDVAARIFGECLTSGDWPGPGGNQQDAEYLSLPSYAASDIDARLELLKE